ncbi:MAG: hypothetical protein IPI22_11265 [Bacteroidetes bacterium]|nr:hypothetical protein [Bacteroidota bacterium]
MEFGKTLIIHCLHQSKFWVRFGHEIGSGGAFTVGSWNIDDITIGQVLHRQQLSLGLDLQQLQAYIGKPPMLHWCNRKSHIYTITVTDAAGCTAIQQWVLQ